MRWVVCSPDKGAGGLEAAGHVWENLEAALVGAGYRVLVLNPLQTRRYRCVMRRKAKTDDIDAHVIAGLLRSGAQASYVPDAQIQSLRELARAARPAHGAACQIHQGLDARRRQPVRPRYSRSPVHNRSSKERKST